MVQLQVRIANMQKACGLGLSEMRSLSATLATHIYPQESVTVQICGSPGVEPSFQGPKQHMTHTHTTVTICKTIDTL